MSGVIAPIKFDNTLFVGPGFRGIKDVFPTISGATNFINGLPSANRPSETNRFIIKLSAGDFNEYNLTIPKWTWVEGEGSDATRIINKSISGVGFIMSSGHAGLSKFSILTEDISALPIGIHIRDTVSLYSGAFPPFTIIAGDTLDLEWTDSGDNSTSVTVTFQTGDITPAAVASRISAAHSELFAFDIQSISVRITAFDGNPIKKMEATGGTALSKLGFVDTVAETPVEAEIKAIDDVKVINGGTGIVQYSVRNDDASNFLSICDRLVVINSTVGGKGYRHGDGGIEFSNCTIDANDVCLEINDDAITNQGDIIQSFNSAFGTRITSVADIKFLSDSTFRISATTYDPQKLDVGAFTVGVQSLTQGASIKYPDEMAFVDNPWTGVDVTQALDEVFEEVRTIRFPGKNLDTSGFLSLNAATDGRLNLFPGKIFGSPLLTDKHAVIPMQIPNLPVFGFRDAILTIIAAPLNAPIAGDKIQFLLNTKAVGSGFVFTGADDSNLTNEIDLSAISLEERFEFTFTIPKTIITSAKSLRMDLIRDGVFTPSSGQTFNGDIFVYYVELKL